MRFALGAAVLLAACAMSGHALATDGPLGIAAAACGRNLRAGRWHLSCVAKHRMPNAASRRSKSWRAEAARVCLQAVLPWTSYLRSHPTETRQLSRNGDRNAATLGVHWPTSPSTLVFDATPTQKAINVFP